MASTRNGDETSTTLPTAPPQYSHDSLPSTTQAINAPLSYMQHVMATELRAQIGANAIILFPSVSQGFTTSTLIQPRLVIAKTPRHQQRQQEGDVKQPYKAAADEDADDASSSKRASKSRIPNAFKSAGKEGKAKAKAKPIKGEQDLQEAAAEWPPDMHYAVLLKVEYDLKPTVLLRGEPRDTIVLALEHLLELTENMMHEYLLQNQSRVHE